MLFRSTTPPPSGPSKSYPSPHSPVAMNRASGPGGGDHISAPSRPTTSHSPDQYHKAAAPTTLSSTVDLSELMQRFERMKDPGAAAFGPDANLPGTGSSQRRGAEGGNAETPSSNSGPATDPRSEAIAELLAKANAMMNSAAAFVKYYEEPLTRKKIGRAHV